MIRFWQNFMFNLKNPWGRFPLWISSFKPKSDKRDYF